MQSNTNMCTAKQIELIKSDGLAVEKQILGFVPSEFGMKAKKKKKY